MYGTSNAWTIYAGYGYWELKARTKSVPGPLCTPRTPPGCIPGVYNMYLDYMLAMGIYASV